MWVWPAGIALLLVVTWLAGSRRGAGHREILVGLACLGWTGAGTIAGMFWSMIVSWSDLPTWPVVTGAVAGLVLSVAGFNLRFRWRR